MLYLEIKISPETRYPISILRTGGCLANFLLYTGPIGRACILLEICFQQENFMRGRKQLYSTVLDIKSSYILILYHIVSQTT